MKKMLAILVALMLLMTAAASAESVFSFADPVLTLNMGEAQTIDLTGLELVIASEEMNGGIAIQIDIKGGGNKLMGIAANIVGEKVVFAFDGGSNVYAVQAPMAPMAAVSSLSSFDMSALNIDFEALMGSVMGSIEMDGDTIKVPYTAVNDVLEAIAPMLESVEIPGLDASQIPEVIAQLKQSNSGVNLELTLTQGEDNVSVSAKAIPVQDGTAAAEAALVVSFNQDESGLALNIEVPGQGAFYFNASPIDGDKVKVSIGGNAQGAGFDLSGIASAGEADVEFAAIDAGNAISIETMTDEQNEAFMGELMSVSAGLIGYVYTALGAAA